MRKENTSPLADDSRGVSEVLGHILIFGIVAVSIGIILVTGLAGLEDTREIEQFQNADRAFDVLADNMASVYERDAPARATEIDLGDSTLTHGDPIHLNISLVPSDSSPVQHKNTTIRPIEFQVSSDRALVYEAGAVFRVQADGGNVIEEPPYLFADERVLLPVVRTRPFVERSVSGTTVLVRAQLGDRAVLQDPSDGPYDEMNVEITSPRAGLWAAYFATDSGIDCDDIDGEILSCTVEPVPEQTYVTYHLLQTSFDL